MRLLRTIPRPRQTSLEHKHILASVIRYTAHHPDTVKLTIIIPQTIIQINLGEGVGAVRPFAATAENMLVFEDDGVGGCVEAAQGHSDVLKYFSFRWSLLTLRVVSDRVEGL